MLNIALKTAVLGASLILPLGVFAQTASSIETVIVTGAYAPIPLADTSSTTTVLDAQYLKSTNKRSVADALRAVPGVLIEEQGGSGGLTAVSLRGGEANFTLVMIDGVQLNDPTNSRGGSFDFSNLDIANIARIEVVRGPQSAFYGSDALAGVINIITRGATPGHHQQIAAEWGEDNYRQYHVDANGFAGDLGYALMLSRRDSGEAVEGSERNNDDFNMGLEWSPASVHEFKIQLRYLDGERTSFPEQSGGPEYAVFRELDKSDYTDATVGASWGWQISREWSSGLSASRVELDDDYSSPGIFPLLEVPPQQTKSHFTRDNVQWVNTLNWGENYRLDLGADYRDETGDSKGTLDFGFVKLPTDFQLERDNVGIFLGAHADVLPVLSLQGSMRHDNPEGFDAETTVNLGLKYELSHKVSLTSNWGQAYKLPSFFALGHALVGNPDLKPETGESWDLGVQWTPSTALLLVTNYFSNSYKNLIDFDAESFTNVNRNQVDTSGAELQLNWSPTAPLQLRTHATYTDIDVKDTSTPLTGRPQWVAGATTIWQINPRWRSALDYQWTGEQYATSRHTGDAIMEVLDDFHRVDMNVAWQATKLLSMQFALDNLLDEQSHNAVGFPNPGRSIRVSIALATGSS